MSLTLSSYNVDKLIPAIKKYMKYMEKLSTKFGNDKIIDVNQIICEKFMNVLVENVTFVTADLKFIVEYFSDFFITKLSANYPDRFLNELFSNGILPENITIFLSYISYNKGKEIHDKEKEIHDKEIHNKIHNKYIEYVNFVYDCRPEKKKRSYLHHKNKPQSYLHHKNKTLSTIHKFANIGSWHNYN